MIGKVNIMDTEITFRSTFKKMEYTNNVFITAEKQPIVLGQGVFRNIPFVIVNTYGWHPCAYINVEENKKISEDNYDEYPFNPHGGITFASKSENYLPEIEDRIWLGWDFAHAGDKSIFMDGHRWTTEEVFQDIIRTINDYYKGEKE